MEETWNTKFGSRRVKQALPTIDEALAAAECLSDDWDQQIEIAASLLGVGEDEVRKVAVRPSKAPPLRTITIHTPVNAAPRRPVVVEYRAPKRLVGMR